MKVDSASSWAAGVLLAAALALAACGSTSRAPLPSSTPSQAPPVSSQPTRVAASATFTAPAATDLPGATVPACLSQPGRIQQTELVDPALPRSLPYRIYLPPCQASPPPDGFPTLILLHGLELSDSQWDELGVDELAEGMIQSGQAPPFLIVMPWERKGLDYERALVAYLLPHIVDAYGGSNLRELRSLGGISRGAGWALRVGLKHPELFGALGLHSPAVLIPDMFDIPGWLQEMPLDQLPELWIDIGDRDTLRFQALELRQLLDEQGVEYSWRMDPGEHTRGYWSDHLADYLRWYVTGWAPLTPAPPGSAGD